MKKKRADYVKGDFFDFMHETIWSQITAYISAHKKNKDFHKDFSDGGAALILAYGDYGMACWGTDDALYQRIGNIMLSSLKRGTLSKDELRNLCEGVIKRYAEREEDEEV